MARGWESKSVEQQQMDSPDGEKQDGNRQLSSGQAEQIRKRQGLQLARSRVLQQLHAASHERHRKMLENALAELDRQLAETR